MCQIWSHPLKYTILSFWIYVFLNYTCFNYNNKFQMYKCDFKWNCTPYTLIISLLLLLLSFKLMHMQYILVLYSMIIFYIPTQYDSAKSPDLYLSTLKHLTHLTLTETSFQYNLDLNFNIFTKKVTSRII